MCVLHFIVKVSSKEKISISNVMKIFLSVKINNKYLQLLSLMANISSSSNIIHHSTFATFFNSVCLPSSSALPSFIIWAIQTAIENEKHH